MAAAAATATTAKDLLALVGWLVMQLRRSFVRSATSATASSAFLVTRRRNQLYGGEEENERSCSSCHRTYEVLLQTVFTDKKEKAMKCLKLFLLRPDAIKLGKTIVSNMSVKSVCCLQKP